MLSSYFILVMNAICGYKAINKEWNDNRFIKQFKSSSRAQRTIAEASSIFVGDKRIYGRSELDSHADTIVAGENCIVMQYTSRSCEVMPYSDEYEPLKDVPVVQAATGYTSSNGQSYILILNEALYMPKLDHSLINPNQLRHYQVEVIDNPYDKGGMYIASPGEELVMGLMSEGTTIYFESWTPTLEDLSSLPHIVLSSPHPWNPSEVQFPQMGDDQKEELENRSFSVLLSFPGNFSASLMKQIDPMEPTWLSRRMINSVSVDEEKSWTIQHNGDKDNLIPENPRLVIGEEELTPRKSFISKDRHSSMAAQDLSERWNISVAQAAMILKATTRRLIRSALMPLARRY